MFVVEYLNNWFNQIEYNYGVNPLIFGAIYCAGIIPFWLSVYKILAGFKRKNFTQVKVFALILALVIIAPFTYVAAWGHNLPFWFWVIAGVLVVYSAYSVLRKLRKKIQDDDH